MSDSFTKEFRLLKSIDFDYLKKDARSFNTPYLRFYYRPSRIIHIKHGRVGFSVSKKVGNAVFRNYLKRCLREFYRTSMLKDKPFDIIVIASPKLKRLKNDEGSIQKELFRCFDLLISKRFSS